MFPNWGLISNHLRFTGYHKFIHFFWNLSILSKRSLKLIRSARQLIKSKQSKYPVIETHFQSKRLLRFQWQGSLTPRFPYLVVYPRFHCVCYALQAFPRVLHCSSRPEGMVISIALQTSLIHSPLCGGGEGQVALCLWNEWGSRRAERLSDLYKSHKGQGLCVKGLGLQTFSPGLCPLSPSPCRQLGMPGGEGAVSQHSKWRNRKMRWFVKKIYFILGGCCWT